MPTEHARVAVVGSYAQALVLTAERIPLAGETLIGHDFRQTYGGKGSDMAVQAARLGADVDYLGVVGDDDYGRSFQRLAAHEGISTDKLRVTTSAPTGVGVIIKDPHARNVIVVDMGANAEFTQADIDKSSDVLTSADVALAQLEIPLDTALHALDVAHSAGVTTILNPAPAVDLSSADLSMVDIVTPNETEARICVGLNPEDDIALDKLGAMLLERGARAVVMTLGGDGAAIITADQTVRVPAFELDVVDSNGAGDSFNAALATAVGEGMELGVAARFASAVAGLCCQGWETVPSYRDRATVDDFLAHAPSPIESTDKEVA